MNPEAPAHPGNTPYGRLRYEPQPEPDTIALCLSGGGFRNALFHLGAVRRLNELGILRRVTTISAVSGGATLAAHLAATSPRWASQPLDADVWEREISAPFRRITSENLSLKAVLKGWLLTDWGTNSAVQTLARDMKRRGLGAMQLKHLPERPRFIFCATDLVTGAPWIFDRSSDEPRSVAMAAAVSSWLLPPFKASTFRRIRLVDGGLSDYRGVEPVWQSHETLLVSDGGDMYQPRWGHSLLWSLRRLAGTVSHHAQLFQKRWLMTSLMSGRMKGGLWSIDSSPLRFQMDRAARLYGYSPELARDVIATIRIDYDEMSTAEAAVLENHGYLMAEAVTLVHLKQLRTIDAPLRIPHPAWMSEQKVRHALRDSSRKTWLGRGKWRFFSRKAAATFKETLPTDGRDALPPLTPAPAPAQSETQAGSPDHPVEARV
ncbi:MAG TPA: patatin-like phospholipase family protein [Vicinamibacterales bacterium]|nr:patatin-like phospholipase family protein [Vicinamibacterales bacterium]